MQRNKWCTLQRNGWCTLERNPGALCSGIVATFTAEYPYKFKCDYTGEFVQFLSTNPAEFERLKKSDINQLSLFENGK